MICRKDGSYIFYNYSGGFCWYLFGPENRLQHDIAGSQPPLPNIHGVVSGPPAPRLIWELFAPKLLPPCGVRAIMAVNALGLAGAGVVGKRCSHLSFG